MECPVKKNSEYEVKIIDNGFEGEGIAKIDDFTIFVEGAIKGEICKILIVKVVSTHAFAKILQIVVPSVHRQEPDCLTYKRCGGCSLRHIDYEETLNIKKQKVQNLVNKELNNIIQVEQTIGMGNPYHYRNKAQYPVGYDKNMNEIFGVYAKRTHEIIPIKECLIQKEISYKIAEYIMQYVKDNKIPVYNEKTGKGILRHIVTKIGIYTGEIMCILVLNEKGFSKELTLANNIVDRFPQVKTVVKNINCKKTNVILGNKNEAIVGRGYITDTLGEYIFKISPMSFYQVNPVQAELLYNIAIEKAKISKEDTVVDLYCGIGTIGIFASKYAKEVYGIEIVKQAIEDAKINAKLNKIENIKFICGDVEQSFDQLIKEEKVKPSIVIVDPPRKGLDETTIKNIIDLDVKKLVYISCNPATMVRDIKTLEKSYELKSIVPVDMFPFTSHVESIAILKIKEY